MIPSALSDGSNVVGNMAGNMVPCRWCEQLFASEQLVHSPGLCMGCRIFKLGIKAGACFQCLVRSCAWECQWGRDTAQSPHNNKCTQCTKDKSDPCTPSTDDELKYLRLNQLSLECSTPSKRGARTPKKGKHQDSGADANSPIDLTKDDTPPGGANPEANHNITGTDPAAARATHIEQLERNAYHAVLQNLPRFAASPRNPSQPSASRRKKENEPPSTQPKQLTPNRKAKRRNVKSSPVNEEEPPVYLCSFCKMTEVQFPGQDCGCPKFPCRSCGERIKVERLGDYCWSCEPFENCTVCSRVPVPKGTTFATTANRGAGALLLPKRLRRTRPRRSW